MKVFNQKQLAIVLLLAIALPFVFFAFLLVTCTEAAWLDFPPVIAFHSYGVLCVSFFAGIQWGVHFCKRTEDSVYLLSALTLTLVWLGVLDTGGIIGLSLLLVGLLLSFAVEYRLSVQRVTTGWFWQVRCVSMALILVSLCLALYSVAKG